MASFYIGRLRERKQIIPTVDNSTSWCAKIVFFTAPDASLAKPRTHPLVCDSVSKKSNNVQFLPKCPAVWVAVDFSKHRRPASKPGCGWLAISPMTLSHRPTCNMHNASPRRSLTMIYVIKERLATRSRAPRAQGDALVFEKNLELSASKRLIVDDQLGIQISARHNRPCTVISGQSNLATFLKDCHQKHNNHFCASCIDVFLGDSSERRIRSAKTTVNESRTSTMMTNVRRLNGSHQNWTVLLLILCPYL